MLPQKFPDRPPPPEQKPGPEEESDIKTETEQLPVTPEKPEAESENIEEREAFPEEVPEVPNTSSFDDTPNTSFSLTFVSLLLISIIGVIVSAMMADDRYYKNKK